MRILAIETATEACSVALFEDGALLAGEHRILGRGHAEQLVPMIAALPDRGHAGRILVSLGPGSFTGVRIGIATARALAIAWNAEVLGYPTLALVAAIGGQEQPVPVTVCMTGGHGEWLIQDFSADGLPQSNFSSLQPDAANSRGAHKVIVGTKASELSTSLSTEAAGSTVIPDARNVLALPTEVLTSEIAPIYGRPPDARLPS
ncbi:tRNA (adenosine(37)-N6)-threonylcarbamoyltransferase complex dimerization subunit type 1 TsaB [Tsuneonella flava]|uniref:tRNA (Adenosine(37)-N6)-threonylcarbamoyltransferase complex dimerization subunit type 1 TsaB n=1 Tax=Tsuneonella flava TaxID=2055955 RepID=A0ABX7KCH1_9SPHN|nr:tRNA (adenosine(37)-N6)-threonylcarbamoyltransferase complex dimerization subunit type 1 TsaB [Tsuneonella flava]QSB44200.1 tRNA (adenosine(37)-N6)-threonylcarbamoyltransferase complex dimerization subunit type 1 TsaB [Tsuneonella flava]